MARLQNSETKEIRNRVTQWLGRVGGVQFTVNDVVKGLLGGYSENPSYSLVKGVSNDLIRREGLGLLTSRKGDVCDSNGGRPPKIYRKKWLT